MKARKILVIPALFLWAGGVYAASSQQDLNARVTRLEQLMESQTLVNMDVRIDELQREVQQLRGQIEEQTHTIEVLQRQQRQQYMDVDGRVSKLEQAKKAQDSAAASAATNSASPPASDVDVGSAGGEEAAYQKAFNILRSLRYDEAVTAFRHFLKRYPNGIYASAAHYWIGEAFYSQRNFREAIPEYQRVVDAFPKSPKVPDSMYKLGVSHRELGNTAAANKILRALVKKFPQSNEARKARGIMLEIRQER